MNGFWGGLSCAIVVLSIGGCSMLKNIGTYRSEGKSSIN